MKIRLTPAPLAGVVLVDHDCYEDERGYFYEPWHARDFAAAGLDLRFVQEAHSHSAYRVVRGLHYQDMTAPMGKLLRCTSGSIFDVVVDLRMSSPTFGRSFAVELSAANRRQIYIPSGFAHGFQTLTDSVDVQYKQTGYYTPSSEGTVAWNDPEIGIVWPVSDPLLSPRDQRGMSLREYAAKPAFD
jgi:dTDP-4-dehydrorhamnose 3,5-epimerase